MPLLDKKYWKGLEELRDDPKFLEERAREFAEELPLPLFYTNDDLGRGGVTPPLQATRRGFLKLMGFSFAGAALAACTRMPVEKAIPYLIKPEEITPGVATWYATACNGCSASCGLLVKNRDGRPIKIEGNPDSPLSQGGVCAAGQATVLSLYDDARLKGPLLDGQSSSWDAVDNRVQQELSGAAAQGGKSVLLTGTINGPATIALIEEWQRQFPNSEHIAYDAVSAAAIPLANEKSFGVKALPHYLFEKAKTIVGLNCDFLGTWVSPVEFARGYASNRKPDGEFLSRHVQFESRMSLTGSNADLRIPIAPSEEMGVAAGLLKTISEMAGLSAGAQQAAPPQGVGKKMIEETSRELWKNRGASLVVSGTNDVALQTVVNAINALLGNIGKTIDLDNPSYQKQGDDAALARLIAEMNDGKVAALILSGVNPAYDAPDAVSFVTGLKKVAFSVSFSDRLDETSSLATAVCPDHHPLEAWNDTQPRAAVIHLQQPVIRPLADTRAFQESLLRWMGRSEIFYDYLRNVWKSQFFGQQVLYLDFDGFWDHAVQAGVFATAPRESQQRAASDAGAPSTAPLPIPANAFELQLYEPIAIRDGRHANNPWLQELPDPVAKVTWENFVSISPAAAKELALADGDIASVRTPRGTLELPVQIQPGQAARTLAIALGYGRARCGKVGEGVGANAYPLIGAASASLEKTGRHVELAMTQTHHSMEGRPIVKETVLGEFKKDPKAGNEEQEQLITLWDERAHNGHLWGMAIDLNSCIGCSACLVSCQAENNVPVVGKDEVRRSREMHWIRIDRYYNGSEDNPETVHQPMMCQHCNNAPCETVCPVLATVHSSDGLNQQVYNRCVGTRYCANNCPYKVRRFNWFDYAHNKKFDFNMNSELGEMVLNPDIVVRSRGVMEKCSMCIQRIQEGKLEAKKNGLPLKDGDIKLACEQSCPTQAITFGDLNDPQSRAAKLHRNGRFYHVLEELNVKPNVGYLTKVRNKKEEG